MCTSQYHFHILSTSKIGEAALLRVLGSGSFQDVIGILGWRRPNSDGCAVPSAILCSWRAMGLDLERMSSLCPAATAMPYSYQISRAY